MNLQVKNSLHLKNSFKLLFKIDMVVSIVLLSMLLVGCDKREVATKNITANSPMACSKVLEFTLKKFPTSNMTDRKLLKMVANDYREIQQHIHFSKICARHSIMASRLLREKPNTVGFRNKFGDIEPITYWTVGKIKLKSKVARKLKRQVKYIHYVAMTYKAAILQKAE